MQRVRNRRWIIIFGAIALLVTAQVGWWTTVFVRDVDIIAGLKLRVYELSEGKADLDTFPQREKISREAFHRRLMFLSEGITFFALICIGLFLLYSALKVEERSRETERNFIEIVSHESKTPLTALKLRIEGLVEKVSADTMLKREGQLLLEEVRRLSSIIEKVMSLNRMERQALTFEILPISDVVKQVLKRIDPLLKEKQVILNTSLDEKAFVRADEFALQNTIQGLLENAVLYNNRSEKKLSVKVSVVAPNVALEVSDNGPGIDEKDVSHIFDRYYRGVTKGNRVPGTGLGLYIVKTLVEAHQGRVQITKTDSTGTTFVVDLPAAESV